jgi:hypothetical protein
MLFLFDNNGIDYWIQNNINDCSNSSISYNKNKDKDIELELDLEMATIKQKSNVKNINNNYKQNKHNLINEKYKNTNYNINYKTNYNDTYNTTYNSNKKWERNISSLEAKYNAYQKTQHINKNTNKKEKLSLLGSHERPKLINL